MSRPRPRLTRRGELVVHLGVAIALTLLVASLLDREASLWVQAVAIAGAAVVGIAAVAFMTATVLVRSGELLAAFIRRRRPRSSGRAHEGKNATPYRAERVGGQPGHAAPKPATTTATPSVHGRPELPDGPTSRGPVSDRHTNPATALPGPLSRRQAIRDTTQEAGPSGTTSTYTSPGPRRKRWRGSRPRSPTSSRRAVGGGRDDRGLAGDAAALARSTDRDPVARPDDVLDLGSRQRLGARAGDVRAVRRAGAELDVRAAAPRADRVHAPQAPRPGRPAAPARRPGPGRAGGEHPPVWAARLQRASALGGHVHRLTRPARPRTGSGPARSCSSSIPAAATCRSRCSSTPTPSG
jgi:hypothetical protein